jgi:hypothetical protein
MTHHSAHCHRLNAMPFGMPASRDQHVAIVIISLPSSAGFGHV